MNTTNSFNVLECNVNNRKCKIIDCKGIFKSQEHLRNVNLIKRRTTLPLVTLGVIELSKWKRLIRKIEEIYDLIDNIYEYYIFIILMNKKKCNYLSNN